MKREVITRGWDGEFIKQIDTYLAAKEEDIRGVCDAHYDQVDTITLSLSHGLT